MLEPSKTILTDNSRLITESLVRAGANVFIGYPITPANLVYAYSEKRLPKFMAAPDEITTLQWMSGFSIAGHIPVTATSFPGYALMMESINMAYMMELPMVIVLIQRLGPATGTATAGAQGDLNVIYGTLSGGYPLPCISMSSVTDYWELPAKALEMAVKLRTPVVLMASKEEVMTLRTLDTRILKQIEPIQREYFKGNGKYLPYKPGENMVPEFLPVEDDEHQIRYTASTHNDTGIIQNTTPDALGNSMRLEKKILENIGDFSFYEYNKQEGAEKLLITYGITGQAAEEAIEKYRQDGKKVSLLVLKTLSPILDEYYRICDQHEKIVVAEENVNGILRRIMFGQGARANVTGVNMIGRMIEPAEIIKALDNHD